MEIQLIRNRFSENATIGNLYFPAKNYSCFVLEGKDRDLNQDIPLPDILKIKVPGQTAIPYGRYEIAMTFSNRFQKTMPQLLHVPGWDGIRIHCGNTHADTEGCLLVGSEIINADFIGGSRAAFDNLYPMLQEACAIEKVFITIKKG